MRGFCYSSIYRTDISLEDALLRLEEAVNYIVNNDNNTYDILVLKPDATTVNVPDEGDVADLLCFETRQ